MLTLITPTCHSCNFLGGNQTEHMFLAMAERHFVTNYSCKIGVTTFQTREVKMWLFLFGHIDVADIFTLLSVEESSKRCKEEPLLKTTDSTNQ